MAGQPVQGGIGHGQMPLRPGERRRQGQPRRRSRLAFQQEAVEALREAITHCQSVGDYTTRRMFEEMIASEEEHIDWIENQLEAIRQIGIELYLSQQLKDED
jgi:bacterioferritin